MIKGIDSLSKKLSQKQLDPEALQRALTKSALLVEATAKLNCPVDTGQLRQSITHNVYSDFAEVGSPYNYAPYIEHGSGLFAVNHDGRQTPWSYQDSKGEWHTTVGQKPQPFLQPAFDANRKAILDIFKKELSK